VTTATMKKRGILDAIIIEPLDLIIAQPPQIFISAASAYLIAAEAAVLLPFPFNVLLAIGAEWGYLRGMASSANVETAWKDRLTWANGALVVMYGALFSLRKFALLPAVEAYHNGTAQTTPLGAVVMTIIHIACIGAVTICAMMAHSAMLAHEARVKRLSEEERNQRNQAQLAAEDARNHEWRQAQLEIEIEKQRQQAQLQIETERARARAELRAATRSATAAQVAPQPKRNHVTVDGVEYPSIQAAADAHGISRQAMAKRIKKEA
jgi:hypothetical protein